MASWQRIAVSSDYSAAIYHISQFSKTGVVLTPADCDIVGHQSYEE